jgi:eukaryotic-like serine/threonine-protein kinase
MESIEGETLAGFLRRRDPLPVSEALEVLGEVALGVGAARAAGVIHRDINPQNVIVGASRAAGEARSRVVKVIDFGLAEATFLAGMTATGMILGPAEYMAPEQVRGAPCDARRRLRARRAQLPRLLWAPAFPRRNADRRRIRAAHRAAPAPA